MFSNNFTEYFEKKHEIDNILEDGYAYIDSEIQNSQNMQSDNHIPERLGAEASRSVEEESTEAKKRVSNIKAKIEKISIAPGEFGKFQNWGEDLHIEEKCFPHLFPYGVGGYMSSALDGKNQDLGYTNYV